MFRHDAYRCVTIKPVADEYFQTQKFREKYPWRAEYRSHICSIPATQLDTDKYRQIFDVVHMLHEGGVVNEKTGKIIDLSHTDKSLIASALSHEYGICSGDGNLIQFVEQEFPDIFKSNISCLGLINQWLNERLIKWNPDKQSVLRDWRICNEKEQPDSEKTKFKKLTGYHFPQ